MGSRNCIRKGGCSNMFTYNSERALNQFANMKEDKFDNQTGSSVILTSTPYFVMGVYKNGVRLELPQDYTISGTTINFVTPLVNDNIVVTYTY